MSEMTGTVPVDTAIHTSDEARARLAKRYASERRFKAYGFAAVLSAILFLILLLSTVVGQGIPAFTINIAKLPVDLSEAKIDPDGTRDPEAIGRADYNGLIRNALRAEFPHVKSRSDRKTLYALVSSGASILLRREVIEDTARIGAGADSDVLLSDTADLYLKGMVTGKTEIASNGIASPVEVEDHIKVLSTANDFNEILQAIKAQLAEQAAALRGSIAGRERSVRRITSRIDATVKAIETANAEDKPRLQSLLKSLENDLAAVKSQIERLDRDAAALETRANAVNAREQLNTGLPSYILQLNGGVLKINAIDETSIEGRVLLPLTSMDDAPKGSWSIERIDVPEASRKVNDAEIVWLDRLRDNGRIETQFNWLFFSGGASREAEFAGVWGAVVGSFFTMLVTLMLSFPLGVAAAIYLEEFAPKNRVTHMIEVNINNLAAVPSIVFGLLGLAVFLSVFGLPRSAPLVGGMVLALMTLPTIIIAARAALKAVPPSIREAALGVGASKLQTVTHHVLPLAMPGILTGTIIGMAQALGETAPLLLIGMVAFIVDIPGGPLDPATVLPVQIYMWADFPEPAFQQKTAAAIMVLLGFLIIMNAMAVVLRKRFERRW